MRTLALIVMAWAALAAPVAAQDASDIEQIIFPGLPPLFPGDAACPAPRCFDVAIPVPEGLSVPENTVRVLLPRRYFSQPDRDFPILYLLHGAGGFYQVWSEQTDIVDLTRGLDLIIVMPDGGRGAQAGWYSDWADGSRQWESFHIDVMIPYLENSLRVLGDGHRAIAGLSMGGFGAFSYAGRHPGLFDVAASFSGFIDTLQAEQVGGSIAMYGSPVASTPSQGVWGDPVNNYAEWQAHNPRNLLATLSAIPLLMTTGNGVMGGEHDDPGQWASYPTETVVRLANDSFRREADAQGVGYHAFFYGPGYHGWPYYREGLAWALPQIMAVIAE